MSLRIIILSSLLLASTLLLGAPHAATEQASLELESVSCTSSVKLVLVEGSSECQAAALGSFSD